MGWMATAIPWASWARVSTERLLGSEQAFERAGGKTEREQLVEQQEGGGAEHGTDDEVDHDGTAPEGRRGGGEQDGGRRNEPAADADQHDESGEPAED